MIKLLTITNTILLSLFCVLNPVSIFAQSEDYELDRQRIVENNIKKAMQWNHRYTQGKPNPDGFIAIETTYDRNGNPVEIINYRSNGDTSSRIVYKYNNENLRTEYLLFQKGDKPKIHLTYKQTIHYNDMGQRNLEVIFDGVAPYRVMYQYYPDGRIKETVKIAPGNVIEEKWEYSYQNSTQIVKVSAPEGVHSYTLTRKYDENDNMISEVRVNASGNEVRRLTFEYNANSQRIMESEHNMENLSRKRMYKYDSNGRLSKIIQELPDGTQFTQSMYKYDDVGNPVEEKWTERKSTPFSHKLSTYSDTGTIKELDSFFAPYNFQVLYRYTYEYY